jgi:multidrug efflux system membrane fusion protein
VFRFFSRRPYIIALSLLFALTAWVATGKVDEAPQNDAEKVAEEVPLLKVRVREMIAEPVQRTITLFGRTVPDRYATLRAETGGRVIEVLAQRGGRVKSGEPIVRLAMNDREQQLAHGRALLRQRQIEYEGAKSLSAKGYQDKVRLAQAASALEDAKAALSRLQLDIEHTTIRAPFDGVLAERMVEVGDYVAISDPVGQVVDLDPLVARVDVTQADVGDLVTGQSARVRFLDSLPREGRIRYIASLADIETNTFKVEVAIDNRDYLLLGGMSAELEIPMKQIQAIRLSPALLSLNEKGDLGVKWVEGDTVRFSHIDLVRSDADGIWIAGLGARVQVITVGQGFVREGDRVEPVPADGDGR